MIRVKICGVSDGASLAAAADAGADWVGLNFYPPSPRAVSPAQAAALTAGRPGGPARVGLFVEPTNNDIAAALAALPLDILQVYAGEERIAALRARFGLPVWRAIGVETASDLPAYSVADGFVLDAKPPGGAALPGGNARAFDWSMLLGWRAPRPWLLAGGLTPENVGAAVAASHAPAVDVSSGVESRRGVKDPTLIRRFVAAARAPAQGSVDAPARAPA